VLPTNAAVETVALADEALGFLNKRTKFWMTQQKPVPPPSELGLKLLRTSTFCGKSKDNTSKDGPDERPFSASDTRDNNRTQRRRQPGNTRRSPEGQIHNYAFERTTRHSPIGQSEQPLNTNIVEPIVKVETLNDSGNDNVNVKKTRESKNKGGRNDNDDISILPGKSTLLP